MILDYNDFTNNQPIKTFESFIKENYEEDEENEPTYEPEDCEECREECENDGIEYESNFTWNKGGWWECDSCGRPC